MGCTQETCACGRMQTVKERRMKKKWSPRIARTKFGWSVDWWGGGKHHQRRFKSSETAVEFAQELQADRQAQEEAEKKARSIQRENVRRGDTVVELLNLQASEKAAVATAIAVLRAAGGRAEDLPAAAREFAAGHLSGASATVGEVLAAHLKDLKALGRSPRTIEQRANLCGKLAAHVGAKSRFAALTRPQIAEWISTAPSGSRSHYYTAAAALCRWGWGRGYSRDYALGGLPKPSAGAREEPEILKPRQVRALLEEARKVDAGMMRYIALGVFAGLRPCGELRGVQWEDIDFEDKKIFVRVKTARKTHRARPVPMADCLAAWLELTPESERRGPVARYSRRHYMKIQERAEVSVGHDVLRHTRCSYRLAEIRDPAIVAHENGHTLAVMQVHYANLRLKDAQVREFWGIVPKG